MQAPEPALPPPDRLAAPSASGGTRAQQTAIGVLALGLLLLGIYTLHNFLDALA